MTLYIDKRTGTYGNLDDLYVVEDTVGVNRMSSADALADRSDSQVAEFADDWGKSIYEYMGDME